MKRLAAGLLLLIASLGVAGSVHAQDVAPDPLPPEVREWLTELDSIHQALSVLQEQALSDPSLSAMRESIGEQMRVAMEAIDPALAESLDRIPEMEAEAQVAESSGDRERLDALGAEAQRIEQRFMAAQNQAMQQRPELVAEVLEFQSALQDKMVQSDPDAPQLIARMQELEERLSARVGQN